VQGPLPCPTRGCVRTSPTVSSLQRRRHGAEAEPAASAGCPGVAQRAPVATRSPRCHQCAKPAGLGRCGARERATGRAGSPRAQPPLRSVWAGGDPAARRPLRRADGRRRVLPANVGGCVALLERGRLPAPGAGPTPTAPTIPAPIRPQHRSAVEAGAGRAMLETRVPCLPACLPTCGGWLVPTRIVWALSLKSHGRAAAPVGAR
jgi:hypothetical protein